MPRYSDSSSSSSTSSNPISENSIVFYRSGGHVHDGISSSLIDFSKYSLWDFSVDTIFTTVDRSDRQIRNFNRFKSFIVTTINESFIAPGGGIDVGDNAINARNIVANSITTDLIATNTITANNLANTITISSQTIQSNNYSTGVSGWSISNSNAEFNDVILRGNLLGGKTSYSDTASGFFIGEDSSEYKMNIGDGANFVKWDGSSLNVSGALSGGTIDIGGEDSSSFHVNSSGDLWIGNATYTNAPFKIASNGVVTVGTTSNSLVLTGLTGGGTIEFGSNSFISASGSITQFSAGSLQILATQFTVYTNVDVPFGNVNITTGNVNSLSSFVDSGSNSSPSFSFSTDSDTGFYRSNTNEVSVSAGGTQIMRWESTQPRVINTASTASTTTWRNDGFGGLNTPSSSLHLKENVQDIEPDQALSVIKKLRPVSFTWRTDSGAFSQNSEIASLAVQVGFIADWMSEVDSPWDLAEYSPPDVQGLSDQEAVDAVSDLNNWTPSYWKEPHMISILTAAVKGLAEKIELIQQSLQ